MPAASNFGYGLSSPMFGPRNRFTRPSRLSKARELVNRERRSRAPGEGFLGGRSGAQINQTARDFPIGWGASHGGRSVPEVERDEYLNTLRAARGAPPIAPMDRRGFVQKWASGVSERANQRYKAGGYY